MPDFGRAKKDKPAAAMKKDQSPVQHGVQGDEEEEEEERNTPSGR